jgi:hypothetical protein
MISLDEIKQHNGTISVWTIIDTATSIGIFIQVDRQLLVETIEGLDMFFPNRIHKGQLFGYKSESDNTLWLGRDPR